MCWDCYLFVSAAQAGSYFLSQVTARTWGAGEGHTSYEMEVCTYSSLRVPGPASPDRIKMTERMTAPGHLDTIVMSAFSVSRSLASTADPMLPLPPKERTWRARILRCSSHHLDPWRFLLPKTVCYQEQELETVKHDVSELSTMVRHYWQNCSFKL